MTETTPAGTTPAGTTPAGTTPGPGTSPDQPGRQPGAADILATIADRLGRDQVFGPPVERGGVTLVPVARLRAGGGGGGPRRTGGAGAGVIARPVGAFSINAEGKVGWHPAVDVNRIVLGGQVTLGLVAAVTVALLRRRRRRLRVPVVSRG